ncbi:MAG: nuclear transport factor 2 family protein [Marinicella sp.]
MSDKSIIKTTINQWHQLIQAHDPEQLQHILADEVVFHSPVLHTPQVGKPLTKMYLTAAFYVLLANKFTYLKQVLDGQHAVLEFEAEIDGISINGVDIITCNDDGKIIEFKVMLRPLKALTMVQEKMFEVLNQNKST